MIKIFLYIIVIPIFLLISCTQVKNKAKKEKDLTIPENVITLNYSDFGPQSRAYKLIGMEWWSWNSHGDSKPKFYDIRVVVYKDISLDEVKKLYPIIKKKKQDYRYLKYSDAIKYLDKHIGEKYSNHLMKTRNKIIDKLGE